MKYTRLGRLTIAWIALIYAELAFSACGIPTDPDETLQRIRSGTLRVGYLNNSPFASESSERPRGLDVLLVGELAASLGTRPEFREGTESELFDDLEHGRLDVVIGGVRKEPAWEKHVTFTKPYFKTKSVSGDKLEYVWAVPRGENGWLYVLNDFLGKQEERVNSTLAQVRKL